MKHFTSSCLALLNQHFKVSVAICIVLACATVITHAQWLPTDGLYGGNVTAFAQHSGVAYVAISGQGILGSTDNGVTWSKVDTDFPADDISAVVVEPLAFYVISGSKGVYKSSDGLSWTHISATLPSAFNKTLVRFGAYLYVGGNKGLYRTSDDGITWEKMSNGLPERYVWTLAVAADVLYVGTIQGMYRTSSADGSVFENIDQYLTVEGLTYPPNVRSILSSGSSIYIGTYGHGVHKSTDNGSTWNQCGKDSRDLTSGLVALKGDKLFAGRNGYGVYEFDSGKDSWEPTGLKSFSLSAIAVLGDRIVVGTPGSGMYMSADEGDTWQVPTGASRVGAQVVDLVSLNGSLYAAASGEYGGGIYKQGSAATGSNWVPSCDGLLGNVFTCLATDGVNLFAGRFEQAGPAMSTDGGRSWADDYGSYDGGLTNFDVTSIRAIGNKVYVGTWGSGIFYTSDGGTTWIQTGLRSGRVLRIVQRGSLLFAGTYNNGLAVSNDDGVTWSAGKTGLTSQAVFDIIPLDADLFAATGSGVFRSSDNGESWTPSGQGIPVGGIISMFLYNNILFAGGPNGGVYQSADRGASWSPTSTGLSDNVVVSLAAHEGYLYAGTTYESVFRIPLDAVSVSEDRTSRDVNQVNVSPNPTDGSTTITVTTAKADQVLLRIFNLMGEEVARLTNGIVVNGTYQATWNCEAMPTGAYYCVVETAEGHSSVTLNIVK